MANAGRHDFNKHLASPRAVKINLHNFKWLASFYRHRCACFHDLSPFTIAACFTRLPSANDDTNLPRISSMIKQSHQRC
jgi:hypothetical protein